jgi:lipopolysaccharide export system permease protein
VNNGIITRIILREWFKALFGAIIVLFLLVTVGDIINGFMRGYTASRVLMEYLLKIPELMSKMLPISALLATLFSFNRLKNHSELMAILAAGYSSKKIYSLITTSSLLIAFLQFVNIGYIKPYSNKIKRNQFEKSRLNESKYLARSKFGDTGLLWYKSSSYFTSFDFFNPKKYELTNVSLYFQSDLKTLSEIYKAERAVFYQDNQWTLHGVKHISNLSGGGFPSITYSATLPMELAETPSDFSQFKSDITTLNFTALYRFISSLKKSGINTSEYEVMLLEPITLSLVCILFSLFPLATIFNPNRRASGFGKSVMFTLSFSILFWLLYSFLVSLGSSGKIPPLFAMMVSPVVFMGYIIIVFQKNRKL